MTHPCLHGTVSQPARQSAVPAAPLDTFKVDSQL
jgi:hypothetical protein